MIEMYYPTPLFSSTRYRVAYTTTCFLDYTLILADHKHEKHGQWLKINGLEWKDLYRCSYSIVWPETIITRTAFALQRDKN